MKKENKEKIAYCGSLFLGAVGAVSLGVAAASNAHLLASIPPEQAAGIAASLYAVSSSFSAVGSKVAEKLENANALKKVQKTLLLVSFCGFATITGADDFVATRAAIEQGRRIDKQAHSLVLKDKPKMPSFEGFVYNDKPLADYSKVAGIMECANDYKIKQGKTISLAEAIKQTEENS